ncbi:MAG: hypothetical protein KA004_02065 [Verrucomicrobiales bacterium]|nr:hypothetical protein [Verrucomicrobiales bacterium]
MRRQFVSAWFAWTSVCGFLAASGAQPLPFEVHSGYFVSNKFEPDEAASFVWLDDQREFDAVFGTVMIGGNKEHRLPPGAFEKRVVVAVIHRGNAVVDYSVQKVSMDGRLLVLRYAARFAKRETTTFACPLIVALPKGDFDAVQFVENGKVLHQLKRKPTAEAWDVECKEPGAVTASVADDRAVLSIQGGKGIGRATVRAPVAGWPKAVVIRAHLRGLEQMVLACGGEKLSAAVASHGGHAARIHRWRGGTEGPALAKDSPFWMEIRRCSAEGKPVAGLPPEGGWFDLPVPAALLEKGEALRLEWIDFYR